MSAVTNLSNSEIVAALGLPSTIIDDLRTAQSSTYEGKMNEFLTPLINKIVYQKVDKLVFSNPFKKYDGYPVDYGDTIENIFVECPDGYTFDKDDTDPFKKYTPSVKPLYKSINYQMQYTTTIQDVLMKHACLNQYGFMELVNSIIDTLGTKKSVDEYTATLSMLNDANIYAGGFETLSIPSADTSFDKYKAITQKIVDTVSDFSIPCKSNNKLGVLTACPKNKCLLIIKYDILNHINLDYLAGVFNLSKVDLINNIIPIRSFDTIKNTIASGVVTDSADVGDNIDFAILDTDGFDNHVCLDDSGMIYNPKGKYTNHFTNLWKIISYKYFKNARAFKISYTD